jgi:competence protein ComGF
MKIKNIRERVFVNIGNKGFTLTEALLALSAFCIIATLTPVAYQLLQRVDHSNVRLQEMQWEVFSSQIKKEIRMSQRIEPQTNRLLLKKDTDTILYELSGTNVRRRLNYTGNETLLQNIKSIRFEGIKNGTLINAQDIWNNTYSVSVRAYINTGS